MAKEKDAPAKEAKTYEVRLKPGHPTGVYHRAGMTFTATAPMVIAEVPESVRNDHWLIVTEAASENAQN